MPINDELAELVRQKQINEVNVAEGQQMSKQGIKSEQLDPNIATHYEEELNKIIQ